MHVVHVGDQGDRKNKSPELLLRAVFVGCTVLKRDVY